MLLLPAFITSLVAAVLYRPIKTSSTLTSGPGDVLLVTAHPDDECMFFAPTILGLHAANVTVSVLSLSRGNADGLGETREAEYMQSLDVLGIPKSRRFIIEHSCVYRCGCQPTLTTHSDLQDDITKLWDPEVVSDVLRPYMIAQNISTVRGPVQSCFTLSPRTRSSRSTRKVSRGILTTSLLSSARSTTLQPTIPV